MQEPILEALTFGCQGLDISEDHSTPVRDTCCERHVGGHGITEMLTRALRDINCSGVTRCPFLACPYEVELDSFAEGSHENFNKNQGFLKHFLIDHNLVIDNFSGIINFRGYLIYLREMMSKPNFELESLCVAFWMDQPMVSTDEIQHNTIPNSVINSEMRHKYFMLTDVVPEEKSLRSRLWAERLEAVLEINRLEREQNDFPYECPLFCNEVCIGNRAHLFLHMAEEHAFHVGQPDNIVFVGDFLHLIRNQLESLKCIYCEKNFKDRATLKEHMRKKQHKRINPLNPEYDRFYMVNYLEAGKSWHSLDQEDAEEERIEEDWIELKDQVNEIVCLLCTNQSENFPEALTHMTHQHSFDFLTLTSQLNFYHKVKLVNFIRRSIYRCLCIYCSSEIKERDELLSHISKHLLQNPDIPDRKHWDHSEFLFPTYENDQFLMFLGDDDNVEATEISSDTGNSDSIDFDDNPMIIPEEMSEIRIPPNVHLPVDLDLDSL